MSGGSSSALFSKTLPISAGRAPSRAADALAPLLRWKGYAKASGWRAVLLKHAVAAIVDGVAAQDAGCAAADFDARGGALDFLVVDFDLGIGQADAGGSRQLAGRRRMRKP